MKLEELVEKSIFILRETKSQFENPVVLWSTGKDSTLTLSLCRDAFFGKVSFPVLHIDTGWKFPVMYEFREKVVKDWDLDLIVEKSNEAGLMKPNGKTNHQKCCQFLNTDVLRKALEKHGFDAVIVSIRHDESSQNLEFWDALQNELGDFHSIRRPILHWDEIDVWRYIEERNLPVNPLYFAKEGKRYRSLGCYPCTAPIESEAATIEEIMQEIETTKIEEGSGRIRDKEAEQIMRKLGDLGYM
jgi:sulfate adenylyltransferase subunit 2